MTEKGKNRKKKRDRQLHFGDHHINHLKKIIINHLILSLFFIIFFFSLKNSRKLNQKLQSIVQSLSPANSILERSGESVANAQPNLPTNMLTSNVEIPRVVEKKNKKSYSLILFIKIKEKQETKKKTNQTNLCYSCCINL